MTAKPLINLWGMKTIGLILFHPSGVRYSNQVGGYTIMHPSEEGIFVPLHWRTHEPVLDEMYAKLEEHFVTGPKYGGECGYGIDAEDADFLDGLFDTVLSTKYLRVDRSRLGESVDAWIYVRIMPSTAPDGEISALFSGFTPQAGVFTWENCD